MFTPTCVQHAPRVAAFLRDRFVATYPTAGSSWLMEVFADVDALFNGRHADYQAADMPYHDYVHTLQVTMCLVHLVDGWHEGRPGPRLSCREYELTVAAALWHDTGYLKLRGDAGGTGAKYTHGHESRGAILAANYLQARGATASEVRQVVEAIHCTNPEVKPGRIGERRGRTGLASCALPTADMVAQMAAPDYNEKLEALYREFEEADDFIGVPAEARTFKSAAELLARTPAFWRRVIRPRLESDLQGGVSLSRPAVPAGDQRLSRCRGEEHRRDSGANGGPPKRCARFVLVRPRRWVGRVSPPPSRAGTELGHK